MSDWQDRAERMVNELVSEGYIQHPATKQAFHQVPRHLFLPGFDLDDVYSGRAIPIRFQDGVPISSSSSPVAMARMIERLDLQPNLSIMEIGAGTGYNAAILSETVGTAGKVVTLEIDEDICDLARTNLANAGYEHVKVICADGAMGYAEEAPYDRIIVTAGVYDLSPYWTEQLQPSGLIIVPLWIRGQQCLVTFARDAYVLRSKSIEGGGFMRLRGALAGPEGFVAMPSGWQVAADMPTKIPVRSLDELLGAAPEPHDALVELIGGSLLAFELFLVSRDSRTIVLSRNDSSGQMTAYAMGLVDYRSPSLCICGQFREDGSWKTRVLSFGSPDMRIAFHRHLETWRQMDNPTIDDLNITVYPQNSEGVLPPEAIERRWCSLVFSWSDARNIPVEHRIDTTI